MLTDEYSLMRSYRRSIYRALCLRAIFRFNPTHPASSNLDAGYRMPDADLQFFPLLELQAQAEALDFVRQHFKRHRGARLEDVLAAHHRFVDLGAAVHVVGLHRQELL